MSRAYVSPHFAVIDGYGKVSVTVKRPEDDDPGITVLVGFDGQDEIHIETATIPALIDALHRMARESRRDRPEYERVVAEFEAERIAKRGGRP